MFFENITCDEVIFSVLFIMEINGNDRIHHLCFFEVPDPWPCKDPKTQMHSSRSPLHFSALLSIADCGTSTPRSKSHCNLYEVAD